MLDRRGAGDTARLMSLRVCIAPIVCLLLTACSFGSAPATTPAAATATPIDLSAIADAEYRLLAEIYKSASPAVVNIEARMDADEAAAAVVRRGSGFIYDQQGHIITNAHLVNDADVIRVTLGSALVLEATLVGADSFSDVAVVKVSAPAERLLPLRIGDSALIEVGQRAIAIGNPFGLNSSMTTGIVSGVGRTLPSAELIGIGAVAYDNPAIIQIDAPIYPGSSGGPLLDSRGLVFGMTTANQSLRGEIAGIGFAVPADTMRRVIPDLLAAGRVDYAWMGISVMREEGGYGVAGLSAALDLPTERGVLLRGVSAGSPAHSAGLRGGDRLVDVRGKTVCAGGDLIVAIDEYYFDDLDALMAYLVQQKRPGDEAALLVIRDRLTLELSLQMASRPATEGPPILGCETAP
ncbi:MAG: trypsin-like peptidase domain-containing protein [Chloroflexi bacterium]|nr:trypsin-like peptidase domain-containing protein [Chloroflexota bacterium]MCY4247608.1 trypsin-like peptidase domain-containing protein [Chloroflexota bacterium]